jgi:hypothetical protein
MPVEVKGAIELRKALRDYAPDLAKKLNFEMAAALKPVVNNAKGFMPSQSPLSGWAVRNTSKARFPMYDPVVAKKGITYKVSPSKSNSRGFKSLARLWNKSAAGAIYETAGRKNPGGNFSSRLSGSIKGQGKMAGRALYRAYLDNQGAAQDAVLKAIESAYRDFQKKGLVLRKAKR